MAPLIPELGALRRSAAIRMGLVQPADPICFAIPKVGIIGPARDYTTSNGTRVTAADYDLAVRMVSMHTPHPAIGLTAAVAVASAVVAPDTVPARLAGHRPSDTVIRLGTPASVVRLEMVRTDDGDVCAVIFQRSVRRLATAQLYVPILPATNPAELSG